MIAACPLIDRVVIVCDGLLNAVVTYPTDTIASAVVDAGDEVWLVLAGEAVLVELSEVKAPLFERVKALDPLLAWLDPLTPASREIRGIESNAFNGFNGTVRSPN